jgi:hydrogenase maturation protease
MLTVNAIAPTATILVAGIGNLFLGDDAFGLHVIDRLAKRPLPANVDVEDFGVRGLDLAYALLQPRPLTILVDATRREGAPGTLYVLELEADGRAELDTHAIDPANILRLVASLGGQPGRILLVGCEPSWFDSDDLSPPVAAAIDPACDLVQELIDRMDA